MAEILAMADILFKASPNSITVETTIHQIKVAISKADEEYLFFFFLFFLDSNKGRKISFAHQTNRLGEGSIFL